MLGYKARFCLLGSVTGRLVSVNLGYVSGRLVSVSLGSVSLGSVTLG
jgi:hypothetical protein